MTGRRIRPGWIALAASLLVHAALLGGLSTLLLPWQSFPDASPAIEARLMPVTPTVAPRPPAPKPAPPVPRPRPVRPAAPQVEPAAVPAESDAIPEAAAPEAAAAPPELAPVEPLPAAAAATDAAEAPPPPLNALPARLDLRFQVRYGLARGEQTLLWVREGDGYTVTSVASATGLAGVFYRGRFVQTSRGRVTSAGLVPEEFWDQRGEKRSSARFDAANSSLTLVPARGAPRHFAYEGVPQDALSLFFQLALTAPPPEGGQLRYQVFNGKKLRDYRYEVRGEETLDTALGALRTLHLVRRVDGDGRFEAWLAIDRHYLPVRVLRNDDKGNEVELVLLSILP